MVAVLKKTTPSPEQTSVAPSLPLFTHPHAGLTGEQFEITAMLAESSHPQVFHFDVVMPYGLTLNTNIQRLLRAKTGMSYIVLSKTQIDVPF